ncbi:nucleoside 2-deoxyribosyltransferase [Arsenicitalea aurantiaca]|uniref:nucleoside 2-deoxyribosyltransferase n=1 Tax=Arsenicitalea aurantiaca TaxID=1783274 RepID=UPI001FCE7E96|nr:nucleoside 2-deoxyribosyltransferase [Arsenicitalea aurantiaca]
MIRVYIAGPEVFLPEGFAQVERKRALCRQYGMEPSARQGDFLKYEGGDKFTFGTMISRHNEELMDASDIVIANLTPFRGVSADPGTVYELGYMVARGAKAFGYTNTARPYATRVAEDHYGGDTRTAETGRLVGPDGLMIENHEMIDNLMIDGGIARSGGFVIRHEAPPKARLTDLTAYEACLARIAETLLGR